MMIFPLIGVKASRYVKRAVKLAKLDLVPEILITEHWEILFFAYSHSK